MTYPPERRAARRRQTKWVEVPIAKSRSRKAALAFVSLSTIMQTFACFSVIGMEAVAEYRPAFTRHEEVLDRFDSAAEMPP